MDPRHPELAISRMRELMKQYDRVEMDMKNATTSARLAELEREASLVIQEICLVAPRLHEAMMQTSRIRRGEIAKGIHTYVPEEKVGNFIKATIGPADNPVEIVSEGVLEMLDAVRKQTEVETKSVQKTTEKSKKTAKKTSSVKTSKKAKK